LNGILLNEEKKIKDKEVEIGHADSLDFKKIEEDRKCFRKEFNKLLNQKRAKKNFQVVYIFKNKYLPSL